MKPGDLIKWRWGFLSSVTEVFGVVICVRSYKSSRDNVHMRLNYSFQVLETNGNRCWYDVWHGDEEPVVLS